MSDTGLTPFIVNMMKAPDTALVKADVARLAAKYDVPVDYARWYIASWLGRAK